MNDIYLYKVAGHVFELLLPKGDSLAQELSQYEPFRIAETDEPPVFRLQVLAERPQMGEFVREIHQDDDGSGWRQFWQSQTMTEADDSNL